MPGWDLDVASQVIGIVVGVLTILGFLIKPIMHLLKKVTLPKDKKDARQFISIITNETRRHLDSNNNFFGEATSKNFYFYNKRRLVYNNKVVSNKFLYRESYILKGQAGCGKSSFLQADYYFNSKKSGGLRDANSCYIYLTADKILHYFQEEEHYFELVKNLANSKYKRIYLYLDGIDEIDENTFAQIKSRIVNLSATTNTPQIIYKVSCRKKFYDSYLSLDQNKDFIELIKVDFEITDWTVEQLKDVGLQYIKIFSEGNRCQQRVEKAIASVLQQELWQEYINSPLLMKMYVYITLYNPSKINLTNSYQFYSDFVQSMIVTSMAKKSQPTSFAIVNQQLDDFASKVFDAYINRKKIIPIDSCLPNLTKDVLSQGQKESTLVHETFFEYFVARKYINSIKNNDITAQTLSVLCQNYANNYSDFITDGIKILVEGGLAEDLTKKLIYIYSRTLSNDNLKKLCLDFSSYSFDNSLLDSLDPISAENNAKLLFVLKYEIVFRLGRIVDHNPLASNFLQLIYRNDRNIYVDMDADYYLAVLKRCCAISSSFLSQEEIELDYVKQMLDFLPNYNANYDLANRSHTLLFYGDVPNVGIFQFQDNVITYAYQKAFAKRIARLSQNLPTNLDEMQTRQTKRTYLFRLFDLATIYTFVSFKGHLLTPEQLQVIQKCNVHFDGASAERINLMQTIKDKLLEQKLVSTNSLPEQG